MKVQSYALEQSTKQLRKENAQIMNETEQLRKENARLAAINSRLDRFEQEHFSNLNQALSTGDS
jgi:serine/threonine protein kinase HipA of HipAB toxin-antitoxin module